MARRAYYREYKRNRKGASKLANCELGNTENGDYLRTKFVGIVLGQLREGEQLVPFPLLAYGRTDELDETENTEHENGLMCFHKNAFRYLTEWNSETS